MSPMRIPMGGGEYGAPPQTYKVQLGVGEVGIPRNVWILSIATADPRFCTVFFSDRLPGAPDYQKVVRQNIPPMRDEYFESVIDLAPFEISDSQLQRFHDIWNLTQAGPSSYFMLRLLWELVEEGMIDARLVKRLRALARYPKRGWVKNGQDYMPVDEEFLQRRWATGWTRTRMN
ncbi:hypothetical protein BJX70DRAFT_395080 [Aspergillus crustosus]